LPSPLRRSSYSQQPKAGVDRPEYSDSRSDAELVAAVNQGDFTAFEAMYLRHRDWVVALAYRFTGDYQLSLDVLQETFLYFLKKFPGFTLSARLQTFLYPAVKNLSISGQRKIVRLQGDTDVLESLAATETDASSNQAGDALAAVLSALPEEQREVLLLRFVEGFSLNEIAEAMEIPLGTVKSRLHNALTALRKDERTRNYFGQ
jgi:RNA polymerase sigma-70 factor (ECF subfamily)